MDRKIIGIVVIYKPDIDKLVYNINKYINDISYLIIWDNSSILNSERKIILEKCVNHEKICFAGNGINQGLGIAFNYALNIAIRDEYEFLMTMDQDSEWQNFPNYLSIINKITDSKIAIFGPKVLNAFENYSLEKYYSNCEISSTEFVISSGAVYKVDILSSIGGFAEEYFIDAIDEEVCYRAHANGYDTVIVNSSFLLQEFGLYKKRKIFGKSVATSNYSPFRYYHITRNHLWLARSIYVNRKQKKLMIYNYVLAPAVKILLFEENKLEKIIAIFKGIVDGILKKSLERRKI